MRHDPNSSSPAVCCVMMHGIAPFPCMIRQPKEWLRHTTLPQQAIDHAGNVRDLAIKISSCCQLFGFLCSFEQSCGACTGCWDDTSDWCTTVRLDVGLVADFFRGFMLRFQDFSSHTAWFHLDPYHEDRSDRLQEARRNRRMPFAVDWIDS